jgi:hypothetical protein
MEDKYPIKEIKIMDGVYIWKPELKTENNSSNNESNKSSNNNINNNNNNELNYKKTSIGENNYLCHGVDDLIKIYEIEFEEIGNKIQSLFQSNEDMLEFDPHDYDLIQAREENLQLIDKKLEEMMKIQEKMKEICDYHPIVNVDIFDYFGIGQKTKNENGKNNNINKNEENLISINDDKKIENQINSINDIEKNKENNSKEQSENDNKIDDNIVTELEL